LLRQRLLLRAEHRIGLGQLRSQCALPVRLRVGRHARALRRRRGDRPMRLLGPELLRLAGERSLSQKAL
jgi:hypothetical protein